MDNLIRIVKWDKELVKIKVIEMLYFMYISKNMINLKIEIVIM